MTIAWKDMVPGAALSAGPTVQYTAPDLTAASIQAVSINNPTAAPVLFSLYRVPPGRSPDPTTCICSRLVAAATLIQGHEAINHKIEAGTRLMASGAGLTLNISGVEYVPGT